MYLQPNTQYRGCIKHPAVAYFKKNEPQLIFTSHNPNLVVNGDTKLVICCDYKESSQQTQGKIKFEGAIDNSEIKNEITSIMEGGEKAFILRKVWILKNDN